MNSRKLALRKETLTELTTLELRGVAGAAAVSLVQCIREAVETYVTCVDTKTIATCTCPGVTGPTCACPTDYACA
ncbi:MAG TPA: hypothetical protein VGX28_08315 [Frankiaceae bacterium]|jgi:hypothetical protein|nr:hypothetical protein [Frankiaceae bacterium]